MKKKMKPAPARSLVADDTADKIRKIDQDGEGLTSWEIDFIASFIDNPPRSFTQKQIEIVDRIWNQRVPK